MMIKMPIKNFQKTLIGKNCPVLIEKKGKQDGQVIGVIFASFSTYGGIGIPVKDIYTFIEEASNLNTGQWKTRL